MSFGIPYIRKKYSLLEIFFGERRLVRWFSRQLWVRKNRPGERWTKWTDDELRTLGWVGKPNEIFPTPAYETEDYRKQKKEKHANRAR